MKATIEHWLYWSSKSEKVEAPKLDFLPIRARRRLGLLTRCLLDVGHRLCEKSTINDVIYASRYGELRRQLEITRGLLDENEVSPSVFSFSVFNTPVALLSLHEGIRGRSRAIFGGEHAFRHGLLQAVLALNSSEVERLLFLFGDESLPEIYGETGEEVGHTKVFGMVLSSHTDNSRITVETVSPERPADTIETGGAPEDILSDWLTCSEDTCEFPSTGYSLVFRKGGA